MNKRRPTQQDVAELANVSKATVSYVINEKKGGNIRISQETQDRVLKAAKKLGYSVNVSAHSLRTRKTNLISVMVPDLVNPVFPKLLRAMQNTALQEGYNLLVFDSNKSVDLENSFYRAMRGRPVDGAALVNFRVNRGEVEAMVRSGIQVVTSTIDLGVPEAGFVWVDDFKVGEMATQHLLALGHKRIAHIAWSLEFSPNQLRYDGYKAAVKSAVGFDQDLFFEIHRDTDQILPILQRLFAQENPPTAIFAGTDMVGIQVITDAKKMGLSIPHDLAVIGVDNIPETTVIEPAMSTVDIQPKIIGETMIACLLTSIEEERDVAATTTIVAPKLVLRHST